MKIRVEPFKPTRGASFVITAETMAERALLFSCVSDDNHLLLNEYEEDDFDLTLPVSN